MWWAKLFWLIILKVGGKMVTWTHCGVSYLQSVCTLKEKTLEKATEKYKNKKKQSWWHTVRSHQDKFSVAGKFDLRSRSWLSWELARPARKIHQSSFKLFFFKVDKVSGISDISDSSHYCCLVQCGSVTPEFIQLFPPELSWVRNSANSAQVTLSWVGSTLQHYGYMFQALLAKVTPRLIQALSSPFSPCHCSEYLDDIVAWIDTPLLDNPPWPSSTDWYSTLLYCATSSLVHFVTLDRLDIHWHNPQQNRQDDLENKQWLGFYTCSPLWRI